MATKDKAEKADAPKKEPKKAEGGGAPKKKD